MSIWVDSWAAEKGLIFWRGRKPGREEDNRLTDMATTEREIPTGVEMAASPKHVQPGVDCAGRGGGWLMSQAHMLASVPDLLVSPVRHLTQQGAARALVRRARKQDNKTCWNCRSHNMDLRKISGSCYTLYTAPTQHTCPPLSMYMCMCMWACKEEGKPPLMQLFNWGNQTYSGSHSAVVNLKNKKVY